MICLRTTHDAGRIVLASTLAICVAGILFIILSGKSSPAPNKVGTRHVVARVYGKPIFEDEIKASEQLVRLAVGKQAKPDVIAEKVHQEEISNLAMLIRRTVRDKCLEPYSASITEDLVSAEVDAKFVRAGIDETKADKIAKEHHKLLEALEANLRGKAASDKIYEEKLAGTSITREQWEAFRVFYGTHEKVSEFRRLIPKSLADMKANSRRSTRKDLALAKIESNLTKDVTVSDEEVMEEYKKRYATEPAPPPYTKVKDDLRQQVMQQKRRSIIRAWWRDQYEKAGILIEDDKYRDALKYLPLTDAIGRDE